MKPKEIRLHIEKLVLHGFTPVDSQRIGVAMQRELTRMLGGQGVGATLSTPGRLAAVDGGSFDAVAEAGPDHTGSRIAECVYRGLNR